MLVDRLDEIAARDGGQPSHSARIFPLRRPTILVVGILMITSLEVFPMRPMAVRAAVAKALVVAD